MYIIGYKNKRIISMNGVKINKSASFIKRIPLRKMISWVTIFKPKISKIINKLKELKSKA